MKVTIAGTGEIAEKIVIEAAKSVGGEVVIISEEQPNYFLPEAIPYRRLTPLYARQKPKPTCTKHHEYQQSKQGHEVKWTCIHCGRIL